MGIIEKIAATILTVAIMALVWFVPNKLKREEKIGITTFAVLVPLLLWLIK